MFGPRGTGKTTWLKAHYPEATFIDLLNAETYRSLLSNPHRLETLLPEKKSLIVIDEIQKIPALLDEVHRLIESRRLSFVLTGSSARKLRRGGVNLLGGRAIQRQFHPLTCWEIGKEFSLQRALMVGLIPLSYTSDTPREFLSAYINSYLREEVQAEGLVRNLSSYSHFLEVASFSQAQPLTMTRVAADVGVDAKVVAGYFDVTEDLLLSYRVPVFSRRAKRRLTTHPKFFFFDVGVFRALRPKGPLDLDSEIDGVALETLFFQHYRALGEFTQWDQKPYYWRTASKAEVDFVSYGEEGLFAFEIKRSTLTRRDDLEALKFFREDYPMAKCFLLNFSARETEVDGIRVLPFEQALWKLPELMGQKLDS